MPESATQEANIEKPGSAEFGGAGRIGSSGGTGDREKTRPAASAVASTTSASS